MQEPSSITNRSTLRRVLIVVGCYLTIALAVASTSGWKTNHSMVNEIAVASEPSTVRGKALWQRENCVVCHSIYGLGGHIGPDLTNVYSKKGSQYFRALITHGNGKMPSFYFSEPELQDLEAYFQYIDSLGTYPLKSAIEQPFGDSK
jgi:nitric oxide reductase subunit C